MPTSLDATALVVRTSGTSGAPKEITLTYGNLLWSAIGSAVALGLDPQERWLCTLPLVHVGGLSIVIRSAIYATTAVVHERFEVDPDGARGPARAAASPWSASSRPRRRAPAVRRACTTPPALRCALAGSAAARRRRAARAGPQTAGSSRVSQTYGLTEACSQVSTQIPGDPGLDAGAPLFCTRLAIAPDGEILR